ncbi:uncharacterized protein LOC106874393 isoform X2 [Octopus bimaculoides]|uniref:uncharacterized protein LOC106874393 isoform X2 n=1 Tax=Octopus bimaculoides TaxID=37653 RepID=UPI00071D4AA0|nr:uncharacterized protein LOC106874393 isoform X2 [Octopus bimaculoides]|eukprot:XP_014777598.1 PREDICTED: uncharacterized protein LOC106874393 isoform X2 [Octopus bimaculoides]
MYAMMATQRFPSSFLLTGLMAFLLMISNVTFADTTVATKQGLPLYRPNETTAEAFMILETKVSFLEESIGETIKRNDFSASLKEISLPELDALREKLVTSGCKNMDIIPMRLNKANAICVLPKGFCKQRNLFSNFIHDLNDVDEKLLPYLVCFVELDDRVNQSILKRISNADEQKTNAILQKVDNEIPSDTRERMKSFLKMLPQSFILNSDVLIKRQNSNRSSNTSTPRRNSNRPIRTVTPSDVWVTRRNSNRSSNTSTPRRNSNRPFRTVTPSDVWVTRRNSNRSSNTSTPRRNSNRPFRTVTPSDVWVTRRNSNRSSNTSTPRRNSNRPFRTVTPSDVWVTRRNSNRPFRTVTPSDVWVTRRNSNRPFRTVTPSDVWVTRRNSNRPFRTVTPMNKRGTRKPKKDSKKKSKWELLKNFLSDDDVTALPDLSFFNEVPFQRLLKIPSKKLCSLLPNLPALNLTNVKKIIIYKKCQEDLRKIASTVPKRLGKLLSLLKTKDIITLKNDQLQNLAVAMCQFESLVNTKMERLLAKMVLPVREFKREENQTKFIKEASCLLKYIKPSVLRQIKLSGENKKFFCKMIGASHLNKLPEGEARNLTKYCMKEVLRNKMELSELGNLLNYVILSDIRNVTESRLLSWASVLQHFLDDDEEIQYTGRKLNKIYKDRLSDMTAEDLEKVGVLVGSWDSKDRRKIPSDSWAQSLQSFVSTCQKMEIENNNNFKFCYKIIPFVLKTRDQTQFRSNDAFSRIKRETRTQKPAPLTCRNITEIKSLVKTLTVEQIMSISKEEFVKCIQVFGKVTNYTSEQLQSLMALVNMTFGPAKNWSAENITELGTLLTGLSLNQIKSMNFSNANIVENLGKFPGFMKHQLTHLFGNWLNTTKLQNILNIKLNDIQLVGNLLCGIGKADLEKLSPQIIMEAIEDIGKLDSCNISEQRMLLDKVLASIHNTNSQWSPELLTGLGPLIRLLNETTLEKLTMSDLQNVSSELIAQIPAIQAAAVKEIIIPQLNSLVNVSEVKMLVTILCETKNVTSLKSLTGAIQNLTQNNLTCTTKERDMFLKKLLNSSSASVTDIFKQIIKNVSSFIVKPPESSLAKFTQDQITNIIDVVMQKIPTMHLDAFFNKWLKDQTIRTKEPTPLDQEMLAFLACGLGFDPERIDEIDGNFIWKALNSEEISFSCTADEQKQWLMKNFKSATDMLQTLAKSNGIEIDSIMGIIKKIDFPNSTSLLYLEKELMEITNFLQTSPELKELMMGVMNATKTYFGNASVLAVASTLCHINITDITKINGNLLREFFAGQYKQCSPSEEKAWFMALLNSTMHKLVEMNDEQLQTLMTNLGQLNVSEMLKEWKLYETISSLPLTNVSATFEKWLKELKLSNVSINTSAKHILLSFLACNLELDANNFHIMPESIKKAVEKFVPGEPCSSEKQRSWLSKNSNLLSRVVTNLVGILKNMTNFEGRDKPDIDDKKDGDSSGNGKNGEDNDDSNDTSDDDGKNNSSNGNVVEEEKMDNKTEVKDGDGDGDDGMQGDQGRNDDNTNDEGNTDKRPNPIISGSGSSKERLTVKDDFPFSDASLRKEADVEFMKKFWNFERSPVSQKETMLLWTATNNAIKLMLKNDRILDTYLAKDKSRVLKLAAKVNKRSAFLNKTEIDEKFLSAVSSVDSESEAQTILAEAMKNIGNKNKKDFIKLVPPGLIKKSGMMVIKEMFNEDTKPELIQLFKPKTETETVTRATKKAEKKKVSLAELGLVDKVMADEPDDSTMNLVLRSSLLAVIPVTQLDKLSEDVLCNKDIAISELKLDQALAMSKKCSSMVKEVLKTDPDKLGILTTKVTKEMLNELDADKTSEVVQEACKYERDLNIDVAKLLFSVLKEKKVNVIKDSDKASCTIKYAINEIKDLDVKSDLEVAKSVCKNLGNSMNEKMSEESGKIFRNLCFELVVDKELSFEEFGNLINFLDVSDIKKLDDEQLLEAAQILSQSVQDKPVFEEISNRLKKIDSLSNPVTLTTDNITLSSIFIAGRDDIDKIPKTNLESASLLLTEAIKTQVLLKKSCITETGDETACSQLDPYLKKVIGALVNKQAKRRRRRRSTTACDCELPSQLGSAAEMINPESLKEMLCNENFLTCMEKLSVVKSWTTNHQAVFAEKAKVALGSPKSTKWSESDLKSVVPAIPGLSVDEIGSLDLNTLDLAFALGNQITWNSDKLKATFDVLYKKLLNSSNSLITSLELQTFRNLLCGMNTNIIQSIKSEEYSTAARELGNIDCFTNEQHKLWVQKAKDVYQDVDKWSDSIIASMGAVISGLSAEDLQKLTSTQITAILPDTIPKIAAESLKNFHPHQFNYLTTSQVQKITAAQSSELNSEQIDIIKEKLKYINSLPEKNNSDGSRSNLNVAVLIFSILLLILY